MSASRDDGVSSDLLRSWCMRPAIVGIMIAFFATLIASIIIPEVNMIEDTISDAAAGKYDFIQDAGLYALAIGILALAYGMRGSNLESKTWMLSSWLLVTMGAAVAVMAYWEGYSPGNTYLTIHSYVVYVYGGAFIAVLWLTSRDLAKNSAVWLWINIPLSIFWAALAVFFFLMGTGWDGLVERVLALSQMVWLYLFACKIEQEGAGKHLLGWLVPKFILKANATDLDT